MRNRRMLLLNYRLLAIQCVGSSYNRRPTFTTHFRLKRPRDADANICLLAERHKSHIANHRVKRSLDRFTRCLGLFYVRN